MWTEQLGCEFPYLAKTFQPSDLNSVAKRSQHRVVVLLAVVARGSLCVIPCSWSTAQGEDLRQVQAADKAWREPVEV